MGLFLWLISKCMQVVIHTLIDITNTNSRKGDDPKLYRQQQNFMTLMQTIGLRSNYDMISPVACNKVKVDKKFGSSFKGKHNVWSVELMFSSQGPESVEILANDLDLVPIITGLDETSKHNTSIFRTSDVEYTNIIFKVVDNITL